MKRSVFQKCGKKLNIVICLFFISLCLSTPLTGAIKISISNGNWSHASNWFPSGVPASTDKIYIFNSITLDQNFTASDTVFVCNTLNFASGKVLTLNPGMLVLVNTSVYDGRIGTMGANANISGNYIFQKWVTRCDGYSTYGSPFNTLTSDFDWYYCFLCQPSWSNVYFYNETQTGNMTNGYYDNIAGQIPRGKGFFYWYSNYNSGQNFPRKITLKGSTNFASSFDFGVTFTSNNGSSDDGYNLISNPFPGTIDWLSGSWSKSRINNAIYTWNSCSGVYASYVSGVGVNGGSRYISSMQGFWVQTNNTNPNLKAGSGTLVNTSQNLLKQSGTENATDNLLRLSLQGDEIAVRLDAFSTSGQDSLTDALKMDSENARICSGTNTSSLDFSINSLSPVNQVVPVKTKGGGILTVTGVSTFPDYFLEIKDLLTGLSQPLTENFQYQFTDTSIATFNKRFEITFSQKNATGIITQEQSPDVVVKSGDQNFTLVPSGFHYPVLITVSDLLGRELYSGTFEQTDISLPRWTEPVILRISDSSHSLVKKAF